MNFKIIFSESNIRKTRFEEEPQFTQFRQLLSERYPQFEQQILSGLVKYVDEDGDLITVSSELEWNEMLEGQRSNGYRVHIVEDCAVEERVVSKVNDVESLLEELEKYMGIEDFKFPEMELPAFDLPEMELPSFEFPEMELPSFELPEMDLPEFTDLQFSQTFDYFKGASEDAIEKGKELINSQIGHFEEVRGRMIAYYNLACAESFLGNALEACDALRVSIASGFDDYYKLLTDDMFDNIKQTFEFQQLIDEITAHLPSDISMTMPMTIPLTKLEAVVTDGIKNVERQVPEQITVPLTKIEAAVTDGLKNIENQVKNSEWMNAVENHYEEFAKNIDLESYYKQVYSFMAHQFVSEESVPTETQVEDSPIIPLRPVDDVSSLTESLMVIKNHYQNEMEYIKELGFDVDEDVLVLLLEQYDGDMESAVKFLVESMN